MGDKTILMIAGIGLIVLGLYLILGKKRSKKEETMTVEATVADHVTERKMAGSDYHGQTATVSSFPVFEYQVKGKTYRVRGSVGITVFTKKRWAIGAKENLEVSISNPAQVFTPEDTKASAAMGILLLVFGLIAFFFSVFSL